METNMKKVGALCFYGQGTMEELSFETILRDETVVQGEVWVSQEALRQAGGINYRLPAKWNYELLLRIVREYVVLRGGEENKQECLFGGETGNESWIMLEKENDTDEAEEEWKADCYLLGKYKKERMALNTFDAAVLGIFQAGGEPAIKYLEQMIGETEAFYEIDNCTCPILIYIGNDVCYGVLDVFSRALGNALEEIGQKVEYYDFSKQGIEELGGYVRRRFKAVIGMQTYMFSVQRESGSWVHDEIDAPKYQFVFDHPIFFWTHLQQIPRQMCVLSLDGNYVNFVKTWLGYNARFLPPGGEEKNCGEQQKDYEITFLGSLGTSGEGLVRKLWDIRSGDRKRSHFLNRYILYMRKNPDQTPETALQKVLKYYRSDYSGEEFWQIFYNERWVIRGVNHYYRNKTIEVLLDAGLALHVYGDGWETSYLWGRPGLIHHGAVLEEDALKVYARSKLSLNIMSGHKDGFTERIANSMLQRAVVVTDRTTYLEKNFVDGEDLVMFDLRNLKALPSQIRTLLEDEKRREQIAENAYVKAVSGHTWIQRAGQLLEFIEEDMRESRSFSSHSI